MEEVGAKVPITIKSAEKYNMADGKNILIAGGALLGLLALAAWSSPAQSSIQVNRPPPPPPRPRIPAPPTPPRAPPLPGSAEAIAAAVEAALGGAAASEGQGQPTMQATPQLQSGVLLPNPAQLIRGQRYKARLELGGFESLASREMVKNQFESIGFSNVQVYMTPAELPPGWPQGALANITNRSRWAEGTWNQSSQSVNRPAQIQNAWTS